MATTVTDTGGAKRLKGAFERLRKELPEVLATIGSEMALAASTRAPSPIVEYQVMMAGEGNPSGVDIPGGPGSTDDGDHRLRFDKPIETYLQPVIAGDVSMIDSLHVGVGNITKLNITSEYTWRNINGDVFYSTFPFWECWEGGLDGTFYIEPRNGKTKHAMLTPGIGKANARETMTKTIPALRMYGSIDGNEIVDTTLIPAIRKIVREA
jgi:hypothetical protein